MNRNQYDNDISIWSPQGKIYQIEYAMEAVKQGSATVGLKSSDFAVLVALKRSSSELSSHQKKIISIDNHCAASIAGLTSDGRFLCNSMRDECLNSKFVFDTELPISRLVTSTSEKMQKPTKVYGRRAYGVGLLIAGYDSQGPHIYQLVPSSNYFDCKAMAIGGRSQSAKTYLEKNLDQFKESSYEDIILHGLRALRECLPNEQELTVKNCTVAVVGKDRPLTILDNDDVAPFLSKIDQTRGRRAPAPTESEEAMDEDEGEAAPAGEGATDDTKPDDQQMES